MKIVLGSDHGGFEVKEKIKEVINNHGMEVIDVGCDNKDSCNYAFFGIKAAKKVASKEADFGIVICGSGIGISIAANKVKTIRCGIAYDDEVTRLMRVHNDANMIAFGARFMSEEDILRRVKIFLEARFEGGRHLERIQKITEEENK
ncbi:MAG TPA: ribose 5-phosphate isomerase B [Candidatus Onthovivens sp.]|nr:ribose 5-phosphate isomerase B [Candidatus Onthovivens sp.]